MPLKVSDGIGAWIKDFRKSDAPQFKGKSEKERRQMAVAAYLDARDEKNESFQEDTTFKVNIDGLPMMFMSGVSPGEVKAKLRSIVKQPSMIKDVDRVTDAEVKKTFRLKAQGRDEVEEEYKYDYGSPESIKLMKKKTPGQKESLSTQIIAKHDEGTKNKKPESYEAQYKRRLVKTTKPEHKAKGYNWRIKGKERPEISIKLYKSKPGQAEFNKQLRRVAGHEFGG